MLEFNTILLLLIVFAEYCINSEIYKYVEETLEHTAIN